MQEKSRARRNGVNRDEALATAAEKYRYWVKYLVMMASQTTKMGQFLTPVVFHHVGFFFYVEILILLKCYFKVNPLKVYSLFLCNWDNISRDGCCC